MSCHDTVAKDKPAVQQISEYFNRGEEIPWQRVTDGTTRLTFV